MWKKAIIGIAIGGVCAYFAFHNVNLEDLTQTLASAKLSYFVLAAPLLALSHLFRSLRWQVILAPMQKVPLFSLYGINAVGFMMINLLPLRLGELVRPLLLSRRESVAYSAALATVAVERIFDGLAVILVLLLGLVVAPLEVETIPHIGWSINFMVYSAVGTFLPLFVFLLVVIIFRERAVTLIDKLTFFLPSKTREQILSLSNRFVDGLRVLKGVTSTLLILLHSLLLWLAISIVTYLTFEAFDLGLPVYATFTVLGIICLGIMLPGPPGFVGNYELFCKAALALFAVEETLAVGFSIASHAFNLIGMFALGLIFLPLNPFTIREIRGVEAAHPTPEVN